MFVETEEIVLNTGKVFVETTETNETKTTVNKLRESCINIGSASVPFKRHPRSKYGVLFVTLANGNSIADPLGSKVSPFNAASWLSVSNS